MSTVVHPSVHMNGTGLETLTREYQAVYDAQLALISAERSLTVHARDYYVQGDNMIYLAQDQAAARRTPLHKAHEEVAVILLRLKAR